MLTPPIPVVLPLLVAALLAALNRRIPTRLSAAVAVLTTLAVGCVAVAMAVYTRDDSTVVYWFGGWTPRAHQAVGICFVIDTVGSMLVLIASVLMAAALVFSSRYFDTVGTIYHTLMLIFLAAMSGFSLTGDLFNLFVFFELMSAAAFALCGYKSEQAGPLEGALNFAVTNAIGAYLVLSGIGLLYGRTGALNLAQIGRRLQSPPDALVLCALAFIVCGFFIKAAIVPFHFWLADAHTVAPAPVCVLFSGIMVPLGLYAVVRVYWSVFSGVMAPLENDLRNLLAGFGAATALTGALLCYLQRNLKRLLAFSTISHMGLLLLGIALLTPGALGGVSLYAMGHALVKGGLFLAAGVVLHRTGSVDEIDLMAKRHHIRWTGGLFLAGAAGLAGAPPFGTFWGDLMIGNSSRQLGYGWMEWVEFAAATVTAGAVFRFAGRAIFHWGPAVEEFTEPGSKIPEQPDTHGGHRHTPAVMYGSAAALIIFGALVGLAPRLTGAAEAAAIQVVDRAAYAQRVLDLLAPYPPTVTDQPATAADLARSLAALLASVLLAAGTLSSDRLRRIAAVFKPVLKPLRDLHSGIIPDYVTWLVLGLAVFGAVAVLMGR